MTTSTLTCCCRMPHAAEEKEKRNGRVINAVQWQPISVEGLFHNPDFLAQATGDPRASRGCAFCGDEHDVSGGKASTPDS